MRARERHDVDLSPIGGAEQTLQRVRQRGSRLGFIKANDSGPGLLQYIPLVKEPGARQYADIGVALARHIGDQQPTEGILQAAKEAGCDMIVMSTHGRRGLDRFLLGSQAQKVMTYSTVPVLICR